MATTSLGQGLPNYAAPAATTQPAYGWSNTGAYGSPLYGPLSTAAPSIPTTSVGAPGALNYSPAYGGNPVLPDPTSTAAQAAQGNLNNLGLIGEETTGAANANAAAAASAIGSNLPGYANQVGAASSNISSELAGQLPQDVIDQITQQAAERGITTGSPGSPNANSGFLKSLGLDSLQLMEQGNTDLSTEVARTPTGPAVSATSGFVTPAQQQSTAAGQSLYNSAPVPAAAGAANANAAAAGRAAGAGAAGSPALPVQPSLPGYGASTGTSAYYGQNQGGQTAAPIGAVDANTAMRLAQLGYNQTDIQNMSAEEAAALTGSASNANSNGGDDYDLNASSYYGPGAYGDDGGDE